MQKSRCSYDAAHIISGHFDIKIGENIPKVDQCGSIIITIELDPNSDGLVDSADPDKSGLGLCLL